MEGRGDDVVDRLRSESRYSVSADEARIPDQHSGTPLKEGAASRALTIVMHDREVHRLEAYAALRRTSLSEMVASYLKVVAEDVIAVAMPSMAARPALYMLRHGGADSVAGFLSRSRWSDLERPMPDVLVRCLRDAEGLLLDIGAGTGYYSLLAATCAPQVSIVSFEPYPAIADLLIKNVELNGLSERIAVQRSAASNRTGDTLLFVPVAHAGTLETSASLEAAFKTRHSQTIPVPATTVDSFMAQLRPQPRLCLIKIDVEGHEAAVLEGAAAQIRNHRPLVFTRILDRSDIQGLTGFITEADYFDLPLVAGERPRLQVAATFEPRGWDHVLIPTERAAEILRLLEHAI